ncbi:hypothetical protein DQ04_00441010 [Trypanosoma grayi]|uniref:hypothetical protein n=1 Tax=Trypanosoma grayi TaxID=71804 RepID=UPI0004F47027|nr:hypothetical protein DQ04_00441010 [Trypanosoma grayi]KEG14476.1 hypothetical protein DQ04_00441010 [Trypanosoma grayi]
MNHAFEEPAEVATVPDARNVRYILRGTRLLTLLINLAAKMNGKEIAKAQNARIEDLPVLLDLTVGLFDLSVEKNIAAVVAFKDLVDVGKNTKWVVEGTLLKIEIDLSSGPEMSRNHKLGTKHVIASIRANTPIGQSKCRATLKLQCEGGGSWPAMLSPRSVVDFGDDTSPPGIVARALQFSPSVSLARMTDSPGAYPGMIELDDFVTLDLRSLPVVKLRLNMYRKTGQFVKFTGDILSGIGVSLVVQCCGESDSPTNRRRGEGKAVNMWAHEEITPSGEEVLVVEFDSTKESGPRNGARCMISNASRLSVKNRYVVDFTAIGPISFLPSFSEVYNSVCRFLDPNPNPLLTLSMPDVRAHVASDFPLRTVSRELKNLVWQAVRLYIIKDYMPHERYEASMSPVAPKVR